MALAVERDSTGLVLQLPMKKSFQDKSVSLVMLLQKNPLGLFFLSGSLEPVKSYVHKHT